MEMLEQLVLETTKVLVEVVLVQLVVLLLVLEWVVVVVLEDNYQQHSEILDRHHQIHQTHNHIKEVVV
tara:strand:+ start:317 stop:520 length:204 start_codon:yes stop_codon:yes gene_type:complete